MILSTYILGIANSAVSFSGVVTSLNNNESNRTKFSANVSTFCYVRQCSLCACLILYSLYEMCLGVLCYISLYALSLHSTLAHLQVPFLCVLGRIRELALHDVINSNFHYI